MPSVHATLSASSAYRWLACPPSARLVEQLPDTESEAAKEGTRAHAWAEFKLKKALGRPAQMDDDPELASYDCPEMDELTDDYVVFVLERLREVREHCPSAFVAVEQRLDFSQYVPDGFGTGDCVIVADDELHIIDFKYGKGVEVSAQENPQMRLYAVGAYEAYRLFFNFENVHMTIYQPRRGNIDTETIPVMELLQWARDYVAPIAQQAYKGEGAFCSGEHCRFCRAAYRCRARALHMLQAVTVDKAPALMTSAELAAVLGVVDDVGRWCKGVADLALDSALSGEELPGFKLVEGRSVRKYQDDEAPIIAALNAAGVKDYLKTSLRGITEMERKLGKRQFQELLGAYVHKPEGKPTLVPISDKRPAIHINTAQEDFSAIED